MKDVDAFLAAHEAIPGGGSHAAGETFGAWRIVSFVARGGSAEVYRAAGPDGKIAALKLPRTGKAPSDVDAIRRLGAKYLPEIYESGEGYVAMEFLEPAEGLAPAKYILGVARAVKFLHRNGIVHRDLKPANVMMRKTGEVVLIDIAAKGGTPGFAAPEQWQERVISPQADIHAMGVILDAMFEGEAPRRWAAIIRRATSSIPAQRFASVDDFIRAVRLRNLPLWICLLSALLLTVAAALSQIGKPAAPVADPQAAADEAEYERIIKDAMDADTW